jgi:AraC-like DNA-binding protein
LNVTAILLTSTVALGLVMTVYLTSLSRHRSYFISCRMLALFFALISISATLLGIHLGYNIPALIEIRALLALAAVPCLYLYFAMAGPDIRVLSISQFIHILPVVGGIIIVLARISWLLDFVLISTYLVYLVALLPIWRDRANHFSRLGENVRQTTNWLLIAILFLAVTLILDVLISIDLAGGGLLGKSTPLVFSVITLIAVVSFSLVGALGRPSLFEHFYNITVEAETLPESREKDIPDAADEELAEKTLQFLKNPAILTDESLTILKLARKLGVPARQLSRAINRVHQCSFSDFLNDRRVQLCQEIMQTNRNRPLMDVMLDAGYVTKSNFYKQFSKRTGLTPAAYRSGLKKGTRS